MLRAIIATLAFVSAPVSAAWHRASTNHFVIYADDDLKAFQAFAQKLKRFDKAVRAARDTNGREESIVTRWKVGAGHARYRSIYHGGHDRQSRRGELRLGARMVQLSNRFDPENPAPLLMYYDSFISEGGRPTPNATRGMRYASALAPQDLGPRVLAAKRLIAEGKEAEARAALIPIAYYPHGGRLAEEARRLIEANKK